MESKFDPELLAYYEKLKGKLKEEHVEYLQKHPEIRQLISDYMVKLLLSKPDDVYYFTSKYFSSFEK